MKNIKIKAKGGGVELCFIECNCVDEAIAEIENLKENSGSFFSGANTKLNYSGIVLDYKEEVRLAESVKKVFGDGIKLVMKNSLSENEIGYSLLENEKICTIVHNTIRSGEKIQSRGNIVIYGDVNPGAEVEAKGDVCIVGSLRGVVQTEGNSRVFALSMKPAQIRIGKAISYNKKNENVGAAVAMAENGEIILQCL